MGIYVEKAYTLTDEEMDSKVTISPNPDCGDDNCFSWGVILKFKEYGKWHDEINLDKEMARALGRILMEVTE